MPTPTYTPLATVTLGSSASSVTFSSIPATYRDLILVVNFTATSGGSYCQIRTNGDTGSNYPVVVIYTDPTALSTSGTYDRFYPTWLSVENATSVFGVSQFMDYSATDKHKTVLHKYNYTQDLNELRTVQAQASRWANTAAITSLEVFGPLGSGATFNLYGVIA